MINSSECSIIVKAIHKEVTSEFSYSSFFYKQKIPKPASVVWAGVIDTIKESEIMLTMNE